LTEELADLGGCRGRAEDGGGLPDVHHPFAEEVENAAAKHTVGGRQIRQTTRRETEKTAEKKAEPKRKLNRRLRSCPKGRAKKKDDDEIFRKVR